MENRPVWDDGAWTALPRLDRDLTADACVIGLGGSGLSCIDELLAMGRTVVGIDAEDVASGAAGRNGGFLLAGTADFHHDAVTALGRARAVRITELTLEELMRISAQAPGVVRITGSLRLASSDDEFADCARQRDAMLADGFAVTDYDGPMGRGLSIPGDASFNPLARCRALTTTLHADGAQLFSRTASHKFGGGVVHTAAGRVRCDQIIVAVDGNLEKLFPELAGTLRTARLQMLATSPTTEVNIPHPVYARYGFDYWQQLPDGSIALGGGRDKAMEEEWCDDHSPSAFIQDYLTSVLRDTLKVSAAITHRWAALVAYNSTGLPVLAQVRPGVWVAGGYSGTGNLMGALAGRALAHAAFGEQTEFGSLVSTSTAGWN